METFFREKNGAKMKSIEDCGKYWCENEEDIKGIYRCLRKHPKTSCWRRREATVTFLRRRHIDEVCI